MFKMIRQFTFHHPKQIIAPTLWLFLSQAFSILPAILAYMAIYLLGQAFYPPYTLDIALLIKIAVIGIAYVLLQYVVELVSYYNTYGRAYHDTADKRIAYIQKLRRQSLGFFSSKESGELISSFASDFANVEFTMSIPNQRLILREKAMSLPEWENAEVMEFVDNGHSGMNFERPAVQELLEMVQAGKVDCIIVKDLSRFGRNSIETGYFIERVFPLYHTRFISVSDHFDTADYKGDTGGIDVAFKHLISECYSRDMSMKTKSAKYAKMRRGEYQSAICPYGYQKSADGRMEPDKEAAEIVSQMFLWAADGNTVAEIVRRLYAQRVPTPAEYRAAKGKPIHDTSRSNGVWSSSAVIHILTDERYAGTYVIGKRAVKEIGGTRSRLKDESEWIKIPDHHPAIVSMELYEQANAVRRQFKQPNKQRRDYLLRGKVFCGYCDHAMSRKGKTTWFYCRHAEVSDNLPCHGLQVREKELEQAIFESIKAHMLPVLGLDICKDDLTLQSVQQAEQEKKLRALQDSKRKLYERYALGEIDLDSYKAEKEKYDIALVGEKNTHAMITARAKRAQGDYEANLKHQDLAKEIGSSTTLTKSLVDTLINKIYIFKDERIEIDYAVRDFFENETTQEMPSCGAEG